MNFKSYDSLFMFGIKEENKKNINCIRKPSTHIKKKNNKLKPFANVKINFRHTDTS